MALDTFFNFRVDDTAKEGFIDKCKSIGRDHNDMLRELVTAFNEGRVRIELGDEHKKLLGDIYK